MAVAACPALVQLSSGGVAEAGTIEKPPSRARIRHVAGVMGDAFFLLEGAVVLLVDDDGAQIETAGTAPGGPDDDPRLAFGYLPPGAGRSDDLTSDAIRRAAPKRASSAPWFDASGVSGSKDRRLTAAQQGQAATARNRFGLARAGDPVGNVEKPPSSATTSLGLTTGRVKVDAGMIGIGRSGRGEGRNLGNLPARPRQSGPSPSSRRRRPTISAHSAGLQAGRRPPYRARWRCGVRRSGFERTAAVRRLQLRRRRRLAEHPARARQHRARRRDDITRHPSTGSQAWQAAARRNGRRRLADRGSLAVPAPDDAERHCGAEQRFHDFAAPGSGAAIA